MSRTFCPWGRRVWLAAALLLPGTASADEPYARSRDYDLRNARIHLRIDPAREAFAGEVTHTLAPLRDGLTRLEFDAVDLTITRVTAAGRPAPFRILPGKLVVTLDAAPRAGQPLDVTIRYEGKPGRTGLRFVLPDARYPHRRAHVWTQGQAEETRSYIPIYDYPNDLTASEMIATVPAHWITLSNGRLLGVRDEPGGMKTWHWQQAQPHAVYLISLVAGEFDAVTESWRSLPVAYYVLRGDAARIPPTFARTREMLEFFSAKFGVDYPWEKYAQIAVEEHFGGMEHTSATTLTASQVLHPRLAAETLKGADDLIAHELAHQWFGDLVTCKDWANLWINEGFASFAEFLWDEARYGPAEAAYSVWESQRRWLAAERVYRVPLTARDFTDTRQYNRNHYTKASLVLHMLRRELGDADFFASLRHFLNRHRHQNVVAGDLVRAIEQATGRSADAFFEQWVYGAGAPRFDVAYDYDDAARQVRLRVHQTQTLEGRVGLFRVPVEVEITTPAGRSRHAITVSQARETFSLPAAERPRMVLFDRGGTLLKSLVFPKDDAEWIYQLRNAEDVPDRLDAARALGEGKGGDAVVAALGEAALRDPFWGIRVHALRALGALGGPAAQRRIEAALDNPQPWVRQVAVELMGRFQDDPQIGEKLERIYREDAAYRVRVAALAALAQQRSPNALALLRAAAAAESPDDRLRIGALRALGPLGNRAAVPLLLEWAAPGKSLGVRAAAIASLGELEKNSPQVVPTLAAFAGEPYRGVRFAAVAALSQHTAPEALAPLEALLAGGELEGPVEQIARDAVARHKHAPPNPAPAPTPSAPAPACGEVAEKLRQRERENAALQERLKSLEESRPGKPKS